MLGFRNIEFIVTKTISKTMIGTSDENEDNAIVQQLDLFLY